MDVAVVETTDPVLVLATREDDRDWAAAALDFAAESHMETTATDAIERVDCLDRVDCVITAADLAHGTGIDVAAAVAQRDPELPVCYVAASPSVADAEAATGAGATVYLPRHRAAAGELVEQLDSLVDEYDRHRQFDRERTLFEAFMGRAPLSLYFKDREARHVCVSSSVASGMEGSRLGRTDLDLYEEQQESMRDTYEDDLAVLSTEEPILQKEERLRGDDGTVQWNRTTKLPWRTDDGELQGLVGVSRDITPVKEREQALERQRWRLQQFAAFASTELREPIESATATLEQARAGQRSLDPGAGGEESSAKPTEAATDVDAFEAVDAALERMQRRISMMLTMARPQTESPEPTWLPLREIVEQVWQGIEGASATFSVTIDAGLEIHADEAQLRQLLEQLFRNALERSPTDAAAPAIDVHLTQSGLVVDDDGPPLNRDDEEPFGYEGSQMRVAVARDLAEAHDWRVTAPADDAGRTRFVVEGCLLRPASLPAATPGDPLPLTAQGDIGGATPPGNATRDAPSPLERGVTDAVPPAGSAWTVSGGGRDVWGDVCEFHGVWTPVGGDVRVEARVTELESVHEYSKAGVATFDPTDDRAPLAYVGLAGSGQTETIGRPGTDDPLLSEQLDACDGAGRYYRIDCIGPWVTQSVSRDGDEWTTVGNQRLDSTDDHVAGLLVCSHTSDATATARFTNVRVSPLSVPTADSAGSTTMGEVSKE